MGGGKRALSTIYIKSDSGSILKVTFSTDSAVQIEAVTSAGPSDFSSVTLYTKSAASAHENSEISGLGERSDSSDRVLHFHAPKSNEYALIGRKQREEWVALDDAIHKEKVYTYMAATVSMEEEREPQKAGPSQKVAKAKVDTFVREFKQMSRDERVKIVQALVAEL